MVKKAFNITTIPLIPQPTSFLLHRTLWAYNRVEVGIVYMDEDGRASTVQVSDTNIILPPTTVSKNQITVNLQSVAPHWPSTTSSCVSSEGAYNTVFSYIFYQQGRTKTQCG